MRRILLIGFVFVLSILHAGLVITLESGKQVDLYSDYYAIIIGNSEYQNFPILRGVKQDVSDVKNMFESLGIQTLVLQDQTGEQMLSALNDFVDVHGKDPKRGLILYYAGHGFTEKRADGSDLGYIIPVDAPSYDSSPGAFRTKSVSMTKINDYVEMVNSKHVLIIFDSCFSGTLFTTRRALPQIISEKSAMPVRQFITAGSADEQVPDNSIFKTTLIKGLTEGFADVNGDGYVTGEELGGYLENEVVNYSRGAQHPKYGKITNPHLDKGDFVFALPNRTPQGHTPVTQIAPASSATMEKLTGHLRITSDFEADIFIEGAHRGLLKPGYALNLKDIGIGESMLELFTPKAKYGILVTVKESETISVEINRAQIVTSNPVHTLKTVPETATFTFDDYPKMSGTTPYQFYDAKPVAYKIILKASRYSNTPARFSSGSSRNENTIFLNSLFGNVSISSEPTGSKVYHKGKEIGITPLELGGEEKGFDPGKYTFKLVSSNPEYGDVEKEIEVNSNETTILKAIHPFNGAFLGVQADVYPIAVYLNGKRNQDLEMGKQLKYPTTPQNIELKIEYIGKKTDNYIDYTESLVLKAQDNVTVNARLIVPNGILILSSSQDKTKFTVLETGQTKPTITDGKKQMSLPSLNYTVAASKWGFYTQQSSFLLPPEKPHNFNAILEPLPQKMMGSYNAWKWNKRISLASLAGTVAFSGLSYMQANSAYNDYQDANSAPAAVSARESYLDKRKMYYTSLSLNVVPVLWYGYSYWKTIKHTNIVRNEMSAKVEQ